MILITGGGTGGHLAIAKAVKECLKKDEVIYIGSVNGQDRAWFENDDGFLKSYFLESRGVVNQGAFGKVKSLSILALSTIKAMRLLKRHNIKVVFSVGGYSSAPSAIASVLLRIPLVIHEQNAVNGALNRALKPYAKYFINSFDETSQIKAYPIASSFFQKARLRSKIETVLFLGGSQGAKAINTLALKLAPILNARGIKIIHQTGQKNLDEVKEAYKRLNIEATIFGFSSDLSNIMAKADFAIARAGASTLWELCANGLPTLFIPYPYASKDHQYFNAKYLVDKNLAYLLRESKLDISKVLNIIDSCNIEDISRGLIELTPRDGAKEIASLLKSID